MYDKPFYYSDLQLGYCKDNKHAFTRNVFQCSIHCETCGNTYPDEAIVQKGDRAVTIGGRGDYHGHLSDTRILRFSHGH